MKDIVPPLFYKYTPIEPWLPDLLSGDSLMFSPRDSFNDPFDSRPGLKVDFNTKEGKNYLQKRIKTSSSLKPGARILEAKRIARIEKNAHSDEYDGIRKLLDSVGILSLATTWDNLLLWAHYAKHHKGICVSLKSDIDLFRIAFKVIYQEELPIIIRPQDSAESMIDKTFLTKSKCWEYEDEWRILKRKASQYEKDTTYYPDKEFQRLMVDCNGPGFYKFDHNAIESVTIGMRTNIEDEKFVRDAMSKLGNGTPLYKAKPSKIKYQVERELLAVY